MKKPRLDSFLLPAAGFGCVLLLLSVLARRQGDILSKTAITELVWEVNFDSHTNVVETAIKRLRAKLDGPFPTKLLHTVRGMGYVLEVREEAGTS